ncbi:hypothetical protein TNCV_2725471 [Trichonephila clavipes]|nr:hypothetical protein TNCV_2725471 [Trichonephila clavipes]
MRKEKSTTLTGKLIQEGLQLCSKLENHFLINAPNSERASKLQRRATQNENEVCENPWPLPQISIAETVSSDDEDQLKRKTPFEFKEYYLDEWANMSSPVQLAEKLEEFEDFKKSLKQKSSSPFVKKQEFRITEKNRRHEASGKFEYNRKYMKFPASKN